MIALNNRWTETAERVYDGRTLIGEGDDGRLYGPGGPLPLDDGWYWQLLDLRRPRHLLAWLHSRIVRRIVWLEVL